MESLAATSLASIITPGKCFLYSVLETSRKLSIGWQLCLVLHVVMLRYLEQECGGV